MGNADFRGVMTEPLGEVHVGNVFVLVTGGYQYNTTSTAASMEYLRSISPPSPQDAQNVRRLRSRIVQTLNVSRGYASTLHSLRPC